MKNLKMPVIVASFLAVSACDVMNEKIEVADDAAQRMAVKLDNSKVNQAINNNLNSVGDKATGFMPEAIRPPAERLRADDSPVLGITVDPETTTPINTVTDDSVSTESTSPKSLAPEVAAIEPAGTDTTAAELPGLPGTPVANEPATDVAVPPVALEPDEGPSTQTFDMVQLTAAGVTLKRVNIRLGPGTDHDVLDTIEAGTPLRVAGRTSNDWLLVEREGQPFGFILGSLVRTAE